MYIAYGKLKSLVLKDLQFSRTLYQNVNKGIPLVVQWLGLNDVTVRALGSTPGGGTKILHASAKKVSSLRGRGTLEADYADLGEPSIQVLLPSLPSVAEFQFSSVAQSCLTLCNPMNRSMPGLPVHHQLPEVSCFFCGLRLVI